MGYDIAKLILKGKETPMVAFLRKSGIDFDKLIVEKKHTSHKLICCEKRSEHSERTCTHGMMDLSVEIWPEDDKFMMSVCHYGLQNGDMMRDPEILYELIGWDVPQGNKKLLIEDAQWIQQDYVGSYREVYQMRDGEKMVSPGLKSELQSFSKMWANNMKGQLHLVKEIEA